MSNDRGELDDPIPVDQRCDWELIAERLTRLTEAADANLSALAQRDTPGAVHDTRVAARRLSVALRNLRRQVSNRERRRCVKALLQIAGTCGALRDADVRQELLRTWLTRAGFEDHPQGRMLIAAAAQERDAASREFQRRMNAPKWSELLWSLSQNAAALVVDHRGVPGEGILRDLLTAQQRRLRRRLRTGTRSRKHRKLHRLRLRIKDARYFAEDFGPLIGAPIAVDLARLRDLQQELGELHDGWRLRKWLKTQYRCYLATNALRELLKARKKKSLKRIRQLSKAILRRGAQASSPKH
jgi:CHAD domain-containing protein